MNGVQQTQPMSNNNSNGNGESAAAIAAATAAAVVAAMSAQQNKTEKEERKVIEAEVSKPTVIDAPTVYPPDAVITTTTRVDTTKNKANTSRNLKRAETYEDTYDIDGFYDTFDGK